MKTVNPRAKVEVVTTYACHAPEALFAEELDPEVEAQFLRVVKNGGLPCDGGGVPGEWCARCYFSVVKNEEFDAS